MVKIIIFLQVHNEREMDRVLAIDGIQLIGINNRNLGELYTLKCLNIWLLLVYFDISAWIF